MQGFQNPPRSLISHRSCILYTRVNPLMRLTNSQMNNDIFVIVVSLSHLLRVLFHQTLIPNESSTILG